MKTAIVREAAVHLQTQYNKDIADAVSNLTREELARFVSGREHKLVYDVATLVDFARTTMTEEQVKPIIRPLFPNIYDIIVRIV